MLPAACPLLANLCLRSSTCGDSTAGGTSSRCFARPGPMGIGSNGDGRGCDTGNGGLLGVLSQLSCLTHLDLSFAEWRLECPCECLCVVQDVSIDMCSGLGNSVA